MNPLDNIGNIINQGNPLDKFTFYDPDQPTEINGIRVKAYQMQEEFSAMVQVYKTMISQNDALEIPTTILEIGSNEGGTLFQWVKNGSHDLPTTIVSCDLFAEGNSKYKDVYPEIVKAGMDVSGVRSYFHFIEGNSHDLETYKKIEALGPYDMIFLDGDHTYVGIRKDFEMYSPLCRYAIAFHDILPHPQFGGFCQVDLFWNQVKKRFRHEEFFSKPIDGNPHCGIGVLYID